MKKILFAVAILAVALVACARMRNEWDAQGGIIGSYRGNYVVVNHSGGKIMDVWVLKNQFVQSEKNSDGWIFKDKLGNVIMLGGDVKVIRVNDAETLTRYREYHAEFGGSY